MATVMKLLGSLGERQSHASSPSSICPIFRCISNRFYARSSKSAASKEEKLPESESEPAYEEEVIPSSGVSRPLSEILKQLNKRVPDGLIRTRVEDGFSIRYIPWHLVNRIMNLHAPEWSGEVRNITYSADGKSVSVVYRVTLYGVDAEVCFCSLVCK
uniref:DNA repair RAD52-like protein 1, mitochondrial n=1 Tax=Kalanchoe fedtschenkoi TaxID=63787 RepID=A0A7N0ZX19_KALFE